jgi:hypothetical protein
VIDWWNVAFNALWIFGAAILLAAFSYHNWLRSETGSTRRQAMRELSWRTWNLFGMTLVCIGWMFGQTRHWWARLLLSVPATWFAWQMLGAIRAHRGRTPRH